MAGITVGSVSIKVTPDFTDFLSKVKTEADLAGKASKITIKVDVEDTASTKLQKLKNYFTQDDAAVSGFSTKLTSLNRSLGSAFDSAGSAASGFLSFAGSALKIPAIVVGVVAALGELSIVAAALPSALAAAGFAAGAVALGMNGIKAAVQPLTPILDSMKTQVSAVFQQALKPQVAAIAKLLPQLTGGFQDIAGSLTILSGAFVSVVTSASGLKAIQTIMANTTTLIQNLQPFVLSMTSGFLTLANVGSKSFGALSGALNTIAVQFDAVVQSLANSGTLTTAFQGLGLIVGSAGKVIVNIFGELITAFAGFGGPLSNLINQLGVGLAPLISASANAFGGLLSAVTPLLGPVGQLAASILNTLVPALQPVGQLIGQIVPIAQQLVTAVAPAFDQLTKSVAALIGGGISGLTPIIQGLTPVLALFVSGLSDIVKFLGPITPVLTTVIASIWLLNIALDANPFVAIGVAIVILVGLVVKFWPQISSAIITAWHAITGALGAAGDFFAGIGKAIAGFVTGVVSSIGGFFGSLGSTIASGISTAFSAVGNFFKSLGSGISTGFQAVVSAVGTAIGAIVSFFEKLPGQALQFLKELPNDIEQALEWVIAEIIVLPAQCAEGLKALGPIIGDAFKNAFIAVKNVVTTAGQDLISFFAALPGRVYNAVVSLTVDLVNIGAAALTAMSNAIQSGASAVVSFFEALPGRILSGIENLGQDLFNLAVSALTSMQTGIDNAAQAIISFFIALPGRIISGLESLYGLLVNLASRVITGFKDEITTDVGGIVSFFEQLPGNILHALGNLGNILLNAGKAIIEGLLNGLKAAVGAVWNFVSGIADKISQLKGPLPYDRKLLVPHGNAIMDGFLEGLKNGYDNVQGFVKGIAPDISTSLSGIGAGGVVGSGSASGMAITQNIYEVPTQSAQSIAMQSSRLLAHALATGG